MMTNWKTRGRCLGLLILALSFVAANASPSLSPAIAASGDAIINYDDADTAMNAAQAEARSHLDRFLDVVIGPDGMAREDAAVKVAIPVNEVDNEIIWIAPFGRQDGAFVGRLANAPVHLDGMALGDIIEFDQSQVRDWYFFGSDGKMYGSFTTRVMLEDLSPASAAEVASILSATPLPVNW